MPKQLTFGDEARTAMKRGIDIMADTVGVTLGPRGRNVVLDKKFGPPQVCSDGVTIAKEIELEDPYENMGAQLLKEAASKTNDVAGDGTTTATVLTQAIIQEGFKNIAAGANPMALKRGIEKGVAAVRSAIGDMSEVVEGKTQIAQVASLSAHDDEMGDLIAEVMEKVGKDGVITVEESKGIDYEQEFVEGMQVDRGYISPYFVTNQDRMESAIEDPYILITDKKISADSAPDWNGKETNVNPEQTLAASLSSCHMMTFLALAAKMKWPVVSYYDKASAFLGKNSKGLLPVISTMPKDNHSLMQLYLDGPKNSFYTFFDVIEKKSPKINNSLILSSHNHLKNKSLLEIKRIQKKATQNIFKNKKVPFRSFDVLNRSENSLGEIFTFFMLETILLGHALKVNPFDQPSVELIKIETNKILKKN